MAQTRSQNLNIRVQPQERTLIARAAEAVNQNVSEFVLSAARKQAEEVLLDRRTFVLDEDAYRAFVEALDAPPRDNPALARLLKRKPAWEG
jgi:uncharacterized protein (DUF1778 family)